MHPLLRTVKVQEKEGFYRFTHNRTFGSFLCYLKLVIRFFKQIFANKKVFTKWQLFRILLTSIIKTPYWLFLKPVLWTLKVKTYYRSHYSFRFLDGEISEKDKRFKGDRKDITVYFFFLPVFYYSAKFNKKDKALIFDKIIK